MMRGDTIKVVAETQIAKIANDTQAYLIIFIFLLYSPARKGSAKYTPNYVLM